MSIYEVRKNKHRDSHTGFKLFPEMPTLKISTSRRFPTIILFTFSNHPPPPPLTKMQKVKITNPQIFKRFLVKCQKLVTLSVQNIFFKSDSLDIQEI